MFGCGWYKETIKFRSGKYLLQLCLYTSLNTILDFLAIPLDLNWGTEVGKDRQQKGGSTSVSKIGCWLERSWEWGPMANNRLKMTAVIRIFLRVKKKKKRLSRSSETFGKKKDIL